MNARDICPCLGVNDRVRIYLPRDLSFALDSGGPVMNIRYRVELNEGERAQLTAMLRGGKHAYCASLNERKFCWLPTRGSATRRSRDSISVGGSTVYRTKRRASWKATLSLALSEEARPGAARKLSCKETALLVATVCSNPLRKAVSAGRSICWPVRWSNWTGHEGLSRETVRRRLAEDDLEAVAPQDVVHSGSVNGHFYVARME